MSGILSFFSGPASSARQTANANSAPHQYSFQRLQQLYEKLSKFRESDLERGAGRDDVVETVRQITEALIWGEQNDQQFFDFFCEKSILADFVRVLGLAKAPKKVKLQLLQTLSMLVSNIRCQTSVYYLLSNNHINRLIRTPLDFEDEEILAYYITFLKSLAWRLDKETIQFFFLQHPEPTFPLYIEATKFFDCRDSMIRTTVRNITLQVYQIEDKPMREFVLRHASKTYFSQLAYHLRDVWLRLDAAASGAQTQKDLAAAQREHDIQQDLLIYLSDVFELGVEELNEVLADRLLNCAILPLLLNGVMAVRSVDGGQDGQTRVLMPFVALFLLRQVFDIFRCPCLLVPLASALLQPCVPTALAFTLPQCPALQDDDGETAPSYLQHDFLPNWLREHFMCCLLSTDDATFLLAASVIQACLAHEEVLAPALFDQRPDERVVRVAMFGDLGEGSPVSERSASSILNGSGSSLRGNYEVFHAILQGLERHEVWHLQTLRALARCILDVFLHPRIAEDMPLDAELWRIANSAMKCAAFRLKDLVNECMTKKNGDAILDAFTEDWEAHKVPLPSVTQFCGEPQRLLPASVWACTLPPRKSVGDLNEADQYIIRVFLLLRRLLADLLQYAHIDAEAWKSIPWSRPSTEQLPVLVGAGPRIREGQLVDFSDYGRIVCGVSNGPKNKVTRYLLLSEYWFLLVQPEALPGNGKATVKTVYPIWQVQPLIDRSDPRTMQIFVSPSCGSALGEASGSVPVPDGPIILSFEDVRSGHNARNHIEGRRGSIRKELMRKLLAFVSECCDRPIEQPARSHSASTSSSTAAVGRA